MKKRIPRRGEYTCVCGAYRFPHRFGGGKCGGHYLAMDHWDKHYGCDKVCRSCNSFNKAEHLCDVIHGGENIRECEVFMEFVHSNEIKLPIRRKKR